MRKISAPGNVSGTFVDYDASTNPDGTQISAQWLNDVQAELIAVQTDQSIAEAAGSNGYILAAIKGIAIQLSKQVGEIFHLNSVKDPAEFDKDDPESFFPALCLSSIEDYTDISISNWPDLVTNLRARVLTYMEGKSGAKSSFDVTAWAVTSSIATLTLADTDAENAILAALSEDNLVHGSFSNWRSITLGSAIGNISAGEYAITDVDTTTRTVKFIASISDGSGSVTANIMFYLNRIPGSTTTVRVYEDSNRALMSAGDDDGTYISGLRSRDAMQEFTGGFSFGSQMANIQAVNGVFGRNQINQLMPQQASSVALGMNGITFNNANSISPKVAKTDENKTRPAANATHRYIWAGTYVA